MLYDCQTEISPENLLEGAGKDLQHIKIRSLADLEQIAIRKLIDQASRHLPKPG